MNRIRLLPEQVANQIAAGEVIERPASVVKELVENALDARPARVAVEIQAGGRGLIRVTDDGVGMSRDDALLCLERHATSKIQRAEDLHLIRTMGFRGEALPSIASVSRMTLTTREREGGADATQVIIHGGKLLEVKAAGSPPGTCLEVRHLFFNLPARRKFLRSDETEYAHIHHYLTLAALAYPEVAFTFTKEGRAIWQLPAVVPGEPTIAGRLAALRERFRALLGSAEGLLPVECSAALVPPAAGPEPGDSDPAETPSPAVLWGYIGQPGLSRSTREDQHLFVNRRPVENRGLNYALLEAYHTALMKGRYPVCCLFPRDRSGGRRCEHPPGQAGSEVSQRTGSPAVCGPGHSPELAAIPRRRSSGRPGPAPLRSRAGADSGRISRPCPPARGPGSTQPRARNPRVPPICRTHRNAHGCVAADKHLPNLNSASGRFLPSNTPAGPGTGASPRPLRQLSTLNSQLSTHPPPASALAHHWRPGPALCRAGIGSRAGVDGPARGARAGALRTNA